MSAEPQRELANHLRAVGSSTCWAASEHLFLNKEPSALLGDSEPLVPNLPSRWRRRSKGISAVMTAAAAPMTAATIVGSAVIYWIIAVRLSAQRAASAAAAHDAIGRRRLQADVGPSKHSTDSLLFKWLKTLSGYGASS